jgi:hypothetical protein
MKFIHLWIVARMFYSAFFSMHGSHAWKKREMTYRFEGNTSARGWKLFTNFCVSFAVAASLVACGTTGSSHTTQSSNLQDIHKIQHIVVIMQENRSFDSYFGTYPGADGIPMANGQPTVCVPDPQTGQCTKPFHNSQDKNGGGPHVATSATADIDKGKMDGFIAQVEKARKGCVDPTNPNCSNTTTPDVMGYHDAREIPNYWTYAKDFVLQDHMFEPNASWSQPAHLFMVSAWSAKCSTPGDPESCVNAPGGPSGLNVTKNDTDGRPDPRPDVRENVPILGNLVNDFDFQQSPRQPVLLPLHPKPGPAST